MAAKKSFVFVLFILCCFALSAQNIQLKVMTYNVRSFEPDFTVQAHIDLIKNEKPDLIAFQEVENRTSRMLKRDLITEIGAATGMFPLFAPAYKKDIGEYGVAMLTRFPVASSYYLPLPRLQAEGAADPRVALLADLILPGNVKLRFAVTHLDHLYGNGNIQLEQSKPLCTPNVLDGNMPVILAGDFNQETGGNAINYLKGFYDKMCNNDYTFQYGSKLDYIFTYPRSKWKASAQKVLYSVTLSDHYPVFSTIEYTP